jgi:hypothetical protein
MFSFSCYIGLERRQSVKNDGTESKTPRYEVTALAGYFRPLEAIKDPKGEIVMYYQRNDQCNKNSKAETRLQCKGSINFSSIYLLGTDFDGCLIGYGEPSKEKFLTPLKKKSKEGRIEIERPNPFYENKEDGYLFIVGAGGVPETIEILVVPNGRYLIQGIAMQLADGQFDDALKQVREVARYAR